MAFDNSYTAVTGATYTAANYNKYTRDNLSAIWVYTTAGDIVYASSATALARLGKPSATSVLTNDSSGVPAWLVGNLRHARTIGNYDAGGQVISATSYTDITNATINIAITKTCTVRMIAHGVFAVQSAGQRALVQAVIDGTGSGDTGAPHTSSAYYVPFGIVWERTGISSGTITCKLQGKANAGGNAGVFERGHIQVDAFAE